MSVDGGSELPMAMARCQATPVRCQDQSIQRLNFKAVPATGAVTDETLTPGESTFVDARGGGLMTPEAYVYARFSPAGLVKVDLTDEQALSSMDWDIAFRRFVIRLNAGVSGPSCVLAARTAPSTTFATLTRVPPDLEWRTEAYFAGDLCEYVADPSGIGGPATVLSSYWKYQQCVQTTENVYVLHLRDDRYVKFEVLSYYDPMPQAVCNSTGMVPMANGAATFRIRWAFIPGP
jgi:hypothetical protein